VAVALLVFGLEEKQCYVCVGIREVVGLNLAQRLVILAVILCGLPKSSVGTGIQ
jgi:hypothetical protein